MPNIQIPNRWISNLSKDQQILELNSTVKCKLGVSSIDGIGVFAIRDISAGERCYITPRVTHKFYNIPYGSLSKLYPEVRKLVMQRWSSIVNGSVFQSPNDDAGLLFFCNHSPVPNYDVVTDTALKNIKKGDEMLEDYRMMSNWLLAYPDLGKWSVSNVGLRTLLSHKITSVVNRVKRNIKTLLLVLTQYQNR